MKNNVISKLTELYKANNWDESNIYLNFLTPYFPELKPYEIIALINEFNHRKG